MRLPVWTALVALASIGCANYQFPRIDPSGDHLFVSGGTPVTSPGPQVAPPPPATVAPGGPGVPVVPTYPAVPPGSTVVPTLPAAGPGLPAAAPGALGPPQPAPAFGIPQPGITLMPNQVVAPVGSEVVMVASVLGEKGPLDHQRVEWLLAPDGAGQFIALGERGYFDCLNALRGLPKKVDNRYAINSTTDHETRLDRGTPTPVDDIMILPGQAWVSVTSPNEGTSRVTAFGPSVVGWDRRQQTATIYWVDAQWVFPPPAINPVGTRHTFTTTVSRQTDAAPLAGWIVRYEITGGPEAGFSPDGSTAIEAPTNDLGQASAEIFQKQPGPGSNQISMQVIRPATAGGAGGRRLTLGAGATVKTWTSSDIAIRVSGPAQASVGSTVTYRIEVTNPSGAPARDLVVTDQAPAGLTFLNSNPAANSSPSGQEWRLGEVGARETRVIEANFRVAQPGSFNYCANVSGAEGLTAKNCTTTSVGQAQVEVRLTGPATATLGSQVRFEIEIFNRGAAPTSGLLIRDAFDVGLEHAVSGSPIERDLPEIAPSSSRKIAVTFKATRPGDLCQDVSVSGPTGAVAATRGCVTVTAPAQPPIIQPPPTLPPTPAQPATPTPAQPPATPPPLIPQPAQPSAGRADMRVTKTGPTQRKVGELAEFVINVANTGTTDLTNLRITDNYEATLEVEQATGGFENRGGALSWKLDRLAPGQMGTWQVNCRCLRETSQACNRVTVTADGDLEKAEQACLQIGGGVPAAATPPAGDAGQLSLSVAETVDPVKVGSETTYQIVLTNKSSSADQQVVVTINLPPEVTLVRYEGRPESTVRPRSINFLPIAELRAGEAINYQVTVRADKPGPARLTVTATSARQRTPATGDETTQVLEK